MKMCSNAQAAVATMRSSLWSLLAYCRQEPAFSASQSSATVRGQGGREVGEGGREVGEGGRGKGERERSYSWECSGRREGDRG